MPNINTLNQINSTDEDEKDDASQDSECGSNNSKLLKSKVIKKKVFSKSPKLLPS